MEQGLIASHPSVAETDVRAFIVMRIHHKTKIWMQNLGTPLPFLLSRSRHLIYLGSGTF
ncbi:hypothetical protein VU07_00475 [Desulfobulbus sp. F4]|nr:hypothetical protein [Desulfobulbus sp. F4]